MIIIIIISETVDDPECSSNFRAGNDATSSKQPKKKQKRASVTTYRSTTVSLTKDSDAVLTSAAYAQSIDDQVARYFYATNTPFAHAMHPEFIKLCNLLRPGYTPPSERRLAGEILDALHKKAIEESKEILSGKTVTMSLDGWSNIHNEPLTCTSVIKMSGDSFLTSVIDSSEHSHTADYLLHCGKAIYLGL